MANEWALIIVLTLAALAGATVSGMIGMAGGMLLLIIMLVVGLDWDIAIPVHAAVQLCSNASRVLAFLKSVRWRPFLIVFIVAAPLPWLGLLLRALLNEQTAKLVIGVLVLYATWAPKQRVARLPVVVAFAIVGVLGGTLGVIFGASGPMIAPFFLREGWAKEQIIATKAVSQAYFHTLKIVAFGSVGFSFSAHWTLIVPMAGAVIVGTFCGKWLLGKISEARFRLLYRGALTILALRLIMEYWI